MENNYENAFQLIQEEVNAIREGTTSMSPSDISDFMRTLRELLIGCIITESNGVVHLLGDDFSLNTYVMNQIENRALEVIRSISDSGVESLRGLKDEIDTSSSKASEICDSLNSLSHDFSEVFDKTIFLKETVNQTLSKLELASNSSAEISDRISTLVEDKISASLARIQNNLESLNSRVALSYEQWITQASSQAATDSKISQLNASLDTYIRDLYRFADSQNKDVNISVKSETEDSEKRKENLMIPLLGGLVGYLAGSLNKKNSSSRESVI